MLIDLLPLFRTDLRTQVSKRMYASDASKTGGGVVYADLSSAGNTETFGQITEIRARKGRHSSVIPVDTAAHVKRKYDDEAPPTHVASNFTREIGACRLQKRPLTFSACRAETL